MPLHGAKTEPTQRGEQRSIGPIQASLGFVRRSTETSCRSTRSSASFDIEDQASNDNQPDSRTTIRQTRRKDTAPDHANRLATAGDPQAQRVSSYYG